MRTTMMKKTFFAFQQFLAKKTSFLTSRQRVNIRKNVAKNDSKKFLRDTNYIVITFISGLIVIAFSPFSVAETNCPDSPQTVEVINRLARFRNAPKYSPDSLPRPESSGPFVIQGDGESILVKFGDKTFNSSLKVANTKGVKYDKKDKDGKKTIGYYCFYQVEVGPQGPTSKWWIEGQNLKNYSSWKSLNSGQGVPQPGLKEEGIKLSDNGLTEINKKIEETINKKIEASNDELLNKMEERYSLLFWLPLIAVAFLIVYLEKEKLLSYLRNSSILRWLKEKLWPYLLPYLEKLRSYLRNVSILRWFKEKLWSCFSTIHVRRLFKRNDKNESGGSVPGVSSPTSEDEKTSPSTGNINQNQSDVAKDSASEQSMQDNNSQTDYLAAIFSQINAGHTTISKELASVKQEINSLSVKIEITEKDYGTKNAEVEKLSQQVSKLQSSVTDISQRVEIIGTTTEKSNQQISELQSYIEGVVKKFSQQISDLQLSSTRNNLTAKDSHSTASPRQPFLASTPTQNLTVEELIRQFNSNNREYFRHDYFKPLDLTSDSREGKLQMNGVRIMQLEVSENVHRGSYLKVEIYGEYWLILNILSQGYNRVKKDIPQNPEVFKIISSSGTFELIKPAKLTKVDSTRWEIEEPGELRL